MSRRRYLSTNISKDKTVNRLAFEQGDFAALLYTWMVPHAEDDATVTADPEELMYEVMPGRRDKSIDDVRAALDGMLALGLIERVGDRLGFPCESFYRYQSYIKEERRRAPTCVPSVEDQRTTPQNSAEQREPAQNTASVNPSPSFSHSVPPSPSHPVRGKDDAREADASAPASDTPFTVFAGFLEEIGTEEGSVAPAWKAKQLAIAKRLLQQGYGEDKVRACARFMRSQDWRTDPFDLAGIEKYIGTWEANGMPAKAAARASPAKRNGLSPDEIRLGTPAANVFEAHGRVSR